MAGIDDIGRIKEILNGIRSNVGTKPGRVFYVNAATGTTVYDGLSRDHPVLTINTAIGLAGHGDVIHVARGTYDEAVSIPAGKNGLQIICEPGVYIVNTTPGTVVAIASDVVYWEGGIIETNGQIGMAINGNWFHGKDIRAYNCTVGFDMNSPHPLLENCRTNETSVAGFDISHNEGYFIDCACHGSPASRGFYLSHTNAHNNVFKRCTTVACTAAGYECVAGADENIFDHCTQSSLCAGPTNAGANNTFASHSQNSLILAGYSLQQDHAVIVAYVDELEARLTALRAGYLDGIPRILCSMDFWSVPQEEVAITAGAGDKALPDVTIVGLPAGATIVRAFAMFKFRMVENTNVAANKLNAAQEIQVRDDTPSAWIDAINFVDDQFSIAASTREGGDVIIGAINLSATVDGNDTYNFQWDEAVADLANLQFNDVQVGLRIWFSI
jgi:hypothetical protein